MDASKQVSRRSFFRIVFFMAVFSLVLNLSVYLGIKQFSLALSQAKVDAGGLFPMQMLLDQTDMLRDGFWLLVFPVSMAIFIIAGTLLWLALRGPLKAAAAGPVSRKQKEAAGESVEDPRIREVEDQRMFLHLLTVLQREGRLVDFFHEDLAHYQDGQIGAAVRPIHESCRRVMAKYIATRSIVDKQEGEEMVIQADFDRSSIKLTGNVTGEPPFKGILRHGGWRAGKIDLPRLSAERDPTIIAPAEVEIP